MRMNQMDRYVQGLEMFIQHVFVLFDLFLESVKFEI